VSGQYVYFQGTDNKLWRINTDGSGGINLALYQTNSSPFVTQKFVYFQGTDDTLWQCNLDGTGVAKVAGYKTSSSPYVTDQYIFFRGTDDKLWRVNLDGSGGVNLGGYKTKSSPVVDTSTNLVYFQGTDNALWRLQVDGSNGVHAGGFATNSTPFVVQPANQPEASTLLPRFMVLTVIYAPPGTTGGKASSSVDYSTQCATGSSNSLNTSFKWGFDISATVGSKPGGGGNGGSGSADFGYSATNGNSWSLDLKSTQTSDISVIGPGADGINHDEDLIYLWLNPQLTVTVDPRNNLNWELGVNGPKMIIQYVHVGWLKNPSTMPAGLAQQLSTAGVTSADYATILSVDPFASGSSAIDPTRFQPVNFTFPYNPPLNSGDPVPVQKYILSSSVTYGSGTSSQTQYSTSFVGSITEGLGDALQATLKATLNLQWTNGSATSTTNQTTQSATASIGGPAFGYSGPADIEVYWDTVYNSFMFGFVSTAVSLSGILKDASGNILANTEVSVTAGGRTYRTVTNAKGEYRFFRTPPNAGAVTVVTQKPPIHKIPSHLVADAGKI